MTLNEINNRTRQHLRDTNKTIFEELNVINGINEGIDRVRSIKALSNMSHLLSPDQEVDYLPDEYHYLLAIFSASRCFFQDEQMQQAVSLMNEFETKLFELKTGVENGEIEVKDPDGNTIDGSEFYKMDYVKDIYFKTSLDVEGVSIDA